MTQGRPDGSRLIAILEIGYGIPPNWPLGDGLWKEGWEADDHPRWPAGTPDGAGGRFRPKDSSEELAERARQLAVRAAIRIALVSGLQAIAAGLLTPVPIIGEVADALLFADLIHMTSEFDRLKMETEVAVDYARKGPHDLDELRLDPNYKSFDLFDDFKTEYGRAGDGFEYHHIVEQGGANEDNFSPEQLQNTDNIVRIPKVAPRSD